MQRSKSVAFCFSSTESFIFVGSKPVNPNFDTMIKNLLSALAAVAMLSACSGGGQKTAETTTPKFTGAKGEVKLMTLDPGHFHAALIQKSMYEQIDPTVFVYAPKGEDVTQHLGRIEAYNKRAENPTIWVEQTVTGTDYLEKCWPKNRAT